MSLADQYLSFLLKDLSARLLSYEYLPFPLAMVVNEVEGNSPVDEPFCRFLSGAGDITLKRFLNMINGTEEGYLLSGSFLVSKNPTEKIKTFEEALLKEKQFFRVMARDRKLKERFERAWEWTVKAKGKPNFHFALAGCLIFKNSKLIITRSMVEVTVRHERTKNTFQWKMGNYVAGGWSPVDLAELYEIYATNRSVEWKRL